MNFESLTLPSTLAALRDEKRKLPFAYLHFFFWLLQRVTIQKLFRWEALFSSTITDWKHFHI
jgi:hypothetical protein